MAPPFPASLKHTAAAAAATDMVSAANQPIEVKRAFANIAAGQAGAQVVAAVAGKKIRVLQFRLHCGGTDTDVNFGSGLAGAAVAISETFACKARGGRADGECRWGHFETASGAALSVTTGVGATMGIGVVYCEVAPPS